MVSSYSTGGGSQLIIEIFGRHQLVCSTRYLIILVAAVVFLCANDTMPRPEATVSSTNAPRNEYRGDKTKTKLDKQQKTNNEFKPAGFSGHESFVRLSSSRASGTPLRYKGFAVADFRDACITSWHQTRGESNEEPSLLFVPMGVLCLLCLHMGLCIGTVCEQEEPTDLMADVTTPHGPMFSSPRVHPAIASATKQHEEVKAMNKQIGAEIIHSMITVPAKGRPVLDGYSPDSVLAFPGTVEPPSASLPPSGGCAQETHGTVFEALRVPHVHDISL